MPGRLLSALVTAGVLTTMTTTITSTVAMPAASAGLVCPPYSGQALSSGLASALPMRLAAGLQFSTVCIDPVEVCPEAWTGPNGQRGKLRDCSFGAAWDGYADAGVHPGPTVRNGLRAELDGAGATGGAHAGAIGCLAFDERHGYTEASANWRCEHVTHDDYGARARMAGVAEPTNLATVTGLAELYPGARIPKQGYGTAKVMPSADLGQHRQSRLAAVVHHPWTLAQTRSVCQAGTTRQDREYEPRGLQRHLGCYPTFL